MSANDIITITLSAEDWALLRAIAEADKADAEQEQTQTEESASLTPEEG